MGIGSIWANRHLALGTNMNRTRKSLHFIGLAFLFNWTLAGLFFLLRSETDSIGGRGMLIVYMFLPMVSAIIVQKFIYKESLKKPLGISFKFNRWFLVAWLLPPVMAFATFGVALLFPGVEYSPEMAGVFERIQQSPLLTSEQLQQMGSQFSSFNVHPIWFFLSTWLIAGITINTLFGFGEELGWRGLLQREFSYMGFWKSSAVIGVIWGIWHAPIVLLGFNYPNYPIIGLLMMTVLTLLLAPIFGYIRIKAKSVIAASIIHGSFNATAGLSILLLKGGSDLIVGVTGIAGFIVLMIVNLCIFFFEDSFRGKPLNATMEEVK